MRFHAIAAHQVEGDRYRGAALGGQLCRMQQRPVVARPLVPRHPDGQGGLSVGLDHAWQDAYNALQLIVHNNTMHTFKCMCSTCMSLLEFVLAKGQAMDAVRPLQSARD